MPTEPGAPHPGSTLAALLRAHRDEVVEEWAGLVRQLEAARSLPQPALIDHIPVLLERVAEMAEAPDHRVEPPLPLRTAERHALERLEEGFDLRDVVLELAVLRDCLLSLVERKGPPGNLALGLRLLNRAIDRTLAASVDRYVEARTRTLRALDRIAAAAFEPGTLDQFLGRLLQVFVESTPAADSGVILLREGDVLRVRASAGLERNDEPGFEIPLGAGIAGSIAASGAAIYLAGEEITRLARSDVLRSAGLRALYGVPLIDNGEVLGVAHMGSLTADALSQQDRLLFDAMAGRATAAIRQHLLRELAEARARALAAAEGDVRESEALFRGVQEASLDGFVYLAAIRDERGALQDFEIRHQNEGASRMNGLPRAEVIGRRYREVFPDIESTIWWQSVARVVESGRPETFEAEYHTREGPAWYRVAMARVLDGVAVSFSDATERRETERTLRLLFEATAALGESLDFDLTLRRIAEVVVPAFADACVVDVKDKKGTVRRVAAHGTEERQAVLDELVARFPPQADSEVPTVQAIRAGTPQLQEVVDEALLRQLGLTPEHIELVRALGLHSYIVVPLRLRDGVRGAIGFGAVHGRRAYRSGDLQLAIDLARRAATALNNAWLFEESQRSVQARENVLAIVSHDLRNPLNTVSLAAEALLARTLRTSSDDTTTRQLEIIRRAVQNMERLIRDLLDMASIQAGRLKIELERQAIAPFLHEALLLLAPQALERGVTLREALHVGDVEVLCDRGRLVQILNNLVGNAIKFCRPGDQVTVSAEAREGHLLFAVADTGPGIPPEQAGRVFDAYAGARGSERGGTGLGLFITRGLVEAHGGRIWVESEPGAGTTFWFTLPVVEGESGRDPSNPTGMGGQRP